MIEYFKGIFSTSNPINITAPCSNIRGILNEDQQRQFSLPFTADEIREAIFQMQPTKAPGPDGLPALFYQKFWSIIGNDVTRQALDILNNQADPSAFNSTFISLIPKCKNPDTPQEFRPINLCNVIMKEVTKAIVNRMKEVLPELISEEQSAFVRGRLIMDNALIAMECFHWMKKK